MIRTWNSAQCYATAWMRGEFGGEWIHVYVWLSPFSVHRKLLQLYQSVILQYKIKSVFKKVCYLDLHQQMQEWV